MNRRRFLYAALVFSLLLTSAGCTRAYYKGYNRLKPGMTQDDVKALLGEPTGVERRSLPPNELREVWIYHVKNLDPRNHLYPKIHLIVFSNGKMLAKDPPNPYAPLQN